MKQNIISILLLLFIIISITILLTGCGGIELKSRWRASEVTIDGIDTEWKGARYLIDKENVTIGLLNDEDYLYIRLSTWDNTIQRQLTGLGFTVWFDPKGGQSKKFGIHFPIGNKVKNMAFARRDKRDDPEQFRKMLEEIQRELEIIGPGKDERRTMLLSYAEETGISVKIGKPKGSLIYELKIPLIKKDEHPYAIGAGAAEKIGIVLETGKIDMRNKKDITDERRGQRDGRDGGLSGMGGRTGSRMGGRRPGPGQIFESFELWLKVTLASKT